MKTRKGFVMTLEIYNQKRKYSSLVTLVLIALMITTMSCNRSAGNNANGNSAKANASQTDESSSAPPFPTKEPQRYQATMVTSGSVGPQGASVPGLAAITNQQMPIARDGDKRRVETEMLPGVKIIYLQTGNGRYAIYPAKKIYAEIKLDGSDNPLSSTQGVPSDFAPDKLISGAPAGAKYENLGTEQVNGRTTTKYRVTTAGTGDSKPSSETIIWADESLGMPIKFESTSTDGSKFTMEMRDIKLEVDSSLFELPKDYRKVEHSELISNALPSIKDVLGIGDEKKSTKKH